MRLYNISETLSTNLVQIAGFSFWNVVTISFVNIVTVH